MTPFITPEEIEKRARQAAGLFARGYNCSQAVVAACADLYGMDTDTALRVSASFGGGIGRMRMTCGAACGMFVLAGLHNGNTLPDAPANKLPNYRLVQSLADDFREENGGIVCADLIGLNGTPPQQKRPCPEMIAEAVRIYLHRIVAAQPERNANLPTA